MPYFLQDKTRQKTGGAKGLLVILLPSRLSKKPAVNKRRARERFLERGVREAYFCHVRFLWRFALRRLRRLCFAILRRRFFLRLPMVCRDFRLNRAAASQYCKAEFRYAQIRPLLCIEQ